METQADVCETTSTREQPLKRAQQRPETAQRLRYEAEVSVIIRKIGSLEDIRKKLGLSQRKMAQLLLVDPSAWTRWVKSGHAPPHIYRSLMWLLALEEKYPALEIGFWLGTRPSALTDEVKAEMKSAVLTATVEKEVSKSAEAFAMSFASHLNKRVSGIRNDELVSDVAHLNSRVGLARIMIPLSIGALAGILSAIFTWLFIAARLHS